MLLARSLSILILLIVIGCEKTEIIQVGRKGTLKGKVWEGYISYHNVPLEGVSVTLQGTVPEISLLTNENGEFVVDNLVTGTYHLVFEKAGYGTTMIPGYTFAGGNEPALITRDMHVLPSFEIKDLEMTILKSDETRIIATVHADEVGDGYFRYYLGASGDLSPSLYEESAFVSSQGDPGPYTFVVNVNTARHPPGTVLYLMVYPCSYPDAGYIDLKTGNIIYSTIGPTGSKIVSAVVPYE